MLLLQQSWCDDTPYEFTFQSLAFIWRCATLAARLDHCQRHPVFISTASYHFPGRYLSSPLPFSPQNDFTSGITCNFTTVHMTLSSASGVYPIPPLPDGQGNGASVWISPSSTTPTWPRATAYQPVHAI